MKTTKRGKGSGRAGRTMSDGQRDALSAFVGGLWSDAERKGQFAELLAALWRDYQSEPEYEDLRRSLSEQSKRRR